MDGFPYEVPEEYQNMPLLKGRATVDMKVKVKDNPNLEECVFRIVLDGYNAPVTAGNFIDLVERHFYDGMDIQRGKLMIFALFLQTDGQIKLSMHQTRNVVCVVCDLYMFLKLIIVDVLQRMGLWSKQEILKVQLKVLLTPVQRKPGQYL